MKEVYLLIKEKKKKKVVPLCLACLLIWRPKIKIVDPVELSCSDIIKGCCTSTSEIRLYILAASIFKIWDFSKLILRDFCSLYENVRNEFADFFLDYFNFYLPWFRHQFSKLLFLFFVEFGYFTLCFFCINFNTNWYFVFKGKNLPYFYTKRRKISNIYRGENYFNC